MLHNGVPTGICEYRNGVSIGNVEELGCLIFSALITTTVLVFSKLSADPMLAMIMLVVYVISDVQLR